MPKTVDAAWIPNLLRPGMTVAIQATTGEPQTIVAALKAAPEASDGVHYLSCLLPGVNRTDPAAFHDSASLTAFFVTGDVADSYAKGKMRFMPFHYSAIAAYFDNHPPVDIGLIQVSPPDADGNCTLGVSVAFAPYIIDKAKVLVAEVNHTLPAPPGSPKLAYDRLDYVVESAQALPQLETGDIPEATATIGRNVAALIRDGDTIQFGIGKVPAAILSCLGDKRDLGVQGGMISDDIVDLVEAGVVTGARKTIDQGKMICGAALGTDKVYQWCADRDDVVFRETGYTHSVRVVSQVDNFVSINSSLEVDLFGQANAEMVAGRQVSGTGGLMDFVRSARMSNGGRSVIALPATAARGKASRIVPKLDAGSMVSCARADVDYIVTEYGAARLRDKSVDERAEALVAIAAPEFRDQLANAWAELRGLPLRSPEPR